MTRNTDDPFALGTRTGLPDALRVLAEALPRADWQGHPDFAGLAQFWMERHAMFRQIMDALRTDTQARLDAQIPADRLAARVQRLGGLLLTTLHEHHTMEDSVYFPKMRRIEPRLLRGFDILDRDHHALDAWLDGFAQAAQTVLRDPTRDATGAFHGEVARLAPLLERHLTDEEDLVVPVILRSGLQ